MPLGSGASSGCGIISTGRIGYYPGGCFQSRYGFGLNGSRSALCQRKWPDLRNKPNDGDQPLSTDRQRCDNTLPGPDPHL